MKIFLVAATVLSILPSLACAESTAGSSSPKAQAICKFVDLKKQKIIDIDGIKVLLPYTGEVSTVGEDAQDVSNKLLALGIGTADKPCTSIDVRSLSGGFSTTTR